MLAKEGELVADAALEMLTEIRLEVADRVAQGFGFRAEQPDVWVCSFVGLRAPSYVEANLHLDVKLLQPGHGLLARTGDAEVRAAKDAGMVMGVFFADLYSDFLWMKRLGVEGILTNCPDTFFDVLG